VQQLIIEFTFIVLISVGIGIVATLTGISGGAFKTPLLIILFFLSAELAAAASLLSAVFVAVAGSLAYYRQKTEAINFRVGLLLVIATIPGTYAGVILRTVFAHAHLLRFIFGIALFPIGLKMMMFIPDDNNETNGEGKVFRISQVSLKKQVMIVFVAFLAGISAGLLGLGGGTLIVPALCIILNFPIMVAAATSMFTMIFTTSAGSLINYITITETASVSVLLYYGLTMGLGMVIGGFIGPKYADRVDGFLLQRLFGFVLIFALVKMMSLGHLWLDPGGSDYLLATMGDVIIWLLIGIPMLILSHNRVRSRSSKTSQENIGSATPIPG
jgi:uncharacterized membrane protein YfcA